MKIHLYTILWNEEEMLPFFFRHYDSIVDRYIIYDNGSTDNTLKILTSHDRVEVRQFVPTHPTSYVLSAQALHNHVWKESRDHANWVIVTAVDEHLYHPLGLGRYLQFARLQGVTAVPALAFQMVSEKFPSPEEVLIKTHRLGAPLDSYNKLSVFNPNAVCKTNFDVGRHSAVPEGRIRYPRRDRLFLLHYKYLGIEYLFHRYALLNNKRGAVDKEKKWGIHYELERYELETNFAELRRDAVDVTSGNARRLIRNKWWR